MSPERQCPFRQPLHPLGPTGSMASELLVFPACPSGQSMVQRPENVIEPRTIVPPVVLHPTSNLWIKHPRQILNRFITPTLKLPSTHFLADALGSLLADRWQEAHEVLAATISRTPRSELMAQEGKLLVFVSSTSVSILAINDLRFLKV